MTENKNQPENLEDEEYLEEEEDPYEDIENWDRYSQLVFIIQRWYDDNIGDPEESMGCVMELADTIEKWLPEEETPDTGKETCDEDKE